MGGILEVLTKKQAKPRGFRYKPMYFNAEKAEFRTYVEKLREERDASDNGRYIPTDFRGKFTRKSHRRASSQLAMYNLRLLVFLSILIAAAYLLFQTSIIDRGFRQFLDLFSKNNGLY